MTSTNLKPKAPNVCACVSSGFERGGGGGGGGEGLGGEAVLPLVTGAGPLVNDPEKCIVVYVHTTCCIML